MTSVLVPFSCIACNLLNFPCYQLIDLISCNPDASIAAASEPKVRWDHDLEFDVFGNYNEATAVWLFQPFVMGTRPTELRLHVSAVLLIHDIFPDHWANDGEFPNFDLRIDLFAFLKTYKHYFV